MQPSVFLFAAFAAASIHFTRQDDPSTTYRVATASIAQDIQAYFQQVTTFSGISSKSGFLDAISQLENTVSESITEIESLPSLDEEDTMVVSIEILNLDDSVKEAVTNTTNQKPIFLDSCLGPTILQFLQTEQTFFAAFIARLSMKVDPSFQDIMDNVHDDLVNAFQTGIDTFADQTTLPASCLDSDYFYDNQQYLLDNYKQLEHLNSHFHINKAKQYHYVKMHQDNLSLNNKDIKMYEKGAYN